MKHFRRQQEKKKGRRGGILNVGTMTGKGRKLSDGESSMDEMVDSVPSGERERVVIGADFKVMRCWIGMLLKRKMKKNRW